MQATKSVLHLQFRASEQWNSYAGYWRWHQRLKHKQGMFPFWFQWLPRIPIMILCLHHIVKMGNGASKSYFHKLKWENKEEPGTLQSWYSCVALNCTSTACSAIKRKETGIQYPLKEDSQLLHGQYLLHDIKIILLSFLQTSPLLKEQNRARLFGQ